MGGAAGRCECGRSGGSRGQRRCRRARTCRCLLRSPPKGRLAESGCKLSLFFGRGKRASAPEAPDELKRGSRFGRLKSVEEAIFPGGHAAAFPEICVEAAEGSESGAQTNFGNLGVFHA